MCFVKEVWNSPIQSCIIMHHLATDINLTSHCHKVNPNLTLEILLILISDKNIELDLMKSIVKSLFYKTTLDMFRTISFYLSL